MPEAAPGAAARVVLLWAPQAWIDGRWREAVLLQSGADGNWLRVEAGVRAAAAGPGAAGRGAAGRWSTRTATPSSARSPAWPSAARPATTTSGRGASRCTASPCASSPRSCRPSPRSCTSNCCAAATRIPASSITCITTATAGRTRRVRPRLALALVEAARTTGIGLTLLPAVYERAGFGQPGLRATSGALAPTPTRCWRCARNCAPRSPAARPRRPRYCVGLALHSLRAATPAAIARLLAGADDAPIHIHVAEQVAEVDDCLAATGRRPIEWLCAAATLDRRWQLVHATHATRGEIDAIARSGAGVVLCPSTEANLGDGVVDLPALAGARRAAGAGLRQQRHPLGAGGTAPAGVRTAPGAARRAAWRRHPRTANRRPRRGCGRGSSAAAPPPPATHAGASKSVRVPTCW